MLASSFQVLWAPKTSFLEFLKPSLWGDGNQAACTLYTSEQPLNWQLGEGTGREGTGCFLLRFPLPYVSLSVREKKKQTRHLHLGEGRGGVCRGDRLGLGCVQAWGQAEHSFQRLLSLLHPILGHTQPSEAAHSRAGCDC